MIWAYQLLPCDVCFLLAGRPQGVLLMLGRKYGFMLRLKQQKQLQQHTWYNIPGNTKGDFAAAG